VGREREMEEMEGGEEEVVEGAFYYNQQVIEGR